MRNALTLALSAGLFLLVGAGASNAQSTLPPDRSVLFETHAIPNDPMSPVIISAEIRLTAANRNGEEVGWAATWIEIAEFNRLGEVVEAWFSPAPALDTADGLWHVTHANADNPSEAEFAMPPVLSGSAISETPGAAPLDFYIAGKDPVEPLNSPYPITSVLDYSFWKSDAPEPIDDGADEPVDTPESADGDV